MKLLLERWRQFIDETAKEGEIQKKYTKQWNTALSILDDGDNKHLEKGLKRRVGRKGPSSPPGALEEGSGGDPIIVIYGPTGSGKSTYKQYFINNDWREIKTHTTRLPRGPEDDEYIFHEEWPGDDKFINTNIYQGHHYGTDPKDFAAPGRAVMLSDIGSVETLQNFGTKLGKRMIILYAKSWTENPEEMEQAMAQRKTPGRFDVWRKELESHENVVSGAHPVTNVEQAKQVVQDALQSSKGG